MLSLAWGLALCAIALYLLKVRSMRHTHLAKYMKKYGDQEITPTVAQRVIGNLATYDAPFLYSKSLEFALFKTYGIPTISKLLLATGALIDKAEVRAEDTGVLLIEMINSDPNSERSTLAIARTNYLHAQYGTQISNDDMLYTLSVFILEPQKWMDRYEWRQMSPIEVQANFVLWKSIGQRMGITGIPDSYAGMQEWSTAYELDNMIYNEKNRRVADKTMEVFLQPIPTALKTHARTLVYAIMEHQVRKAFNYPDPPAWTSHFISAIFLVRKLVLRHLCLPRSTPYAKVGTKKNALGRYNMGRFLFVPLYMRPTFGTWVWCKLMGLDGPGEKWHSDGYVIEELGPEMFKTRGVAEVRKQAQEMRACPFA